MNTNTKKMVKIIFISHCLVALFGHVFAVLIPIGVFNIALINTDLDFWSKTVLLGATFFSTIYCVNHVGNAKGFCLLTDLENHYRRLAGLPEAPIRFVPRFYKAIGRLVRWTKK